MSASATKAVQSPHSARDGEVIRTDIPERIGYLIGAAAMIVAAFVELWIGVEAENRSLEQVAEPLSTEGSVEGSVDGAEGNQRSPAETG